MEYRWIYMTAKDEDEAARIGRALLEQRLVACVNILGKARSLYWWEGAIQDDSEVVFVAKTRAELVDELTRTVQDLHSYDIPCVVALPILNGNPDYLAWLANETKRLE